MLIHKPARIFITDTIRAPKWRVIIGGLSRTDAVIFRDYHHPHRLEYAHEVAALCRARGIGLLIAGDWRLAHALNAGMHMPAYMARAALNTYKTKPIGLFSTAVHSEAALHRAAALGANMVLISPVFPTQSHKNARVLGVLKFMHLANCARNLHITPYALGGMNVKTIKRLRTGTGHMPHFAAIDMFSHIDGLYFSYVTA